jgi:hypothetical protein
MHQLTNYVMSKKNRECASSEVGEIDCTIMIQNGHNIHANSNDPNDLKTEKHR